MPSAPPKSSMSLGELAICEDVLGGHREYAVDLLSNIEKIRQWHRTDNCPETREGRTCTVCELCSADGLMGETKKALVSYDDAEKHLLEARASFGKNIHSHAVPGRETLFKSNLAVSIFVHIVTVGDTLRSQHATWQARLQSEVATSFPSAQISQHISDPSVVDKKKHGDRRGSTNSSPRFVGPETNPKLTAVPTGFVPEDTQSSSTFIVLRRCLSSDCPCEANRASAASNTNSRGTRVSQVTSKDPPSRSDSKKTRTSKVTAKKDAATRGGGSHAMRATAANPERSSRETNETPGVPAKAKTNAQTQKPSAHPKQNDHAPGSRNARHEPPNPRQKTASSTRETEPSSPSSEYDTLIVDPRVFRLRAQIAQSDDARRALMAWCRAWTTNPNVDPREKHGTGPRIPPTHASTMEGTRGYLSALAQGLQTTELGKSLCVTSRDGDAATNSPYRGDEEATAQELRFTSEQEDLKGRWLLARQKRCHGRKSRPALVGVDPTPSLIKQREM